MSLVFLPWEADGDCASDVAADEDGIFPEDSASCVGASSKRHAYNTSARAHILQQQQQQQQQQLQQQQHW